MAATVRAWLPRWRCFYRQHDQILKHHDEALIRLEQSMEDLPEAIKNKIGFKKS